MADHILSRIEAALKATDKAISRQLAAIIHHPSFLKLEGSWRGLQYLVTNAQACGEATIKVLNVTKRELFRDFDTAVEFDRITAFRLIYSDEFDTPGGEPF